MAADWASYGVGGLTRTEVAQLRSAAATDPGLVLAALENLGERDTRRFRTNRLVDEALLYEFTGARHDPAPTWSVWRREDPHTAMSEATTETRKSP